MGLKDKKKCEAKVCNRTVVAIGREREGVHVYMCAVNRCLLERVSFTPCARLELNPLKGRERFLDLSTSWKITSRESRLDFTQSLKCHRTRPLPSEHCPSTSLNPASVLYNIVLLRATQVQHVMRASIQPLMLFLSLSPQTCQLFLRSDLEEETSLATEEDSSYSRVAFQHSALPTKSIKRGGLRFRSR